ncbi:MAG: YqeG family HAD IIIA-type phosphatase [Synechococcales cyanobacterium CRU_2_2]|nr:YqeG family HAD IIIA-type phosphatase [Synechococcales cyanobacterium CRU_2_2]
MTQLNRLLRPSLVLQGTVLDLTPELLNHHGLRGLILDVDDTLLSTYSGNLSAEVHQWIDSLRPHTQIWLVSNNINRPRIAKIGRALDLPYLWGAGKPSRRKLRQAAEEMALPSAQLGMVGDRLFTDVIAGNRLGMFTVLVEPMVNPQERPRKHRLRSFEIWLSRLMGAFRP